MSSRCSTGSPVATSAIRGVLKKLKADKNPRLALLYNDMIQFLKRSSKYLQERLPLQNKFLLSVQYLKPSMRSIPDSINTLAVSVPHMACEMKFLDSVFTEWRMYQADADISPEWIESADGHVALVDEYWSQVAKQKDGLGTPKYINLMLVVKAALSAMDKLMWRKDSLSTNTLSMKHELT